MRGTSQISFDKDSQVVIRLENVSKKYILHQQKPFLAREVVKRVFFRKTHRREFWALRDASFEITDGEAVGIIGENGAGKSTLLGIIVGATYPTCGRVIRNGNIGALLELGAGFHPDLTGRENIYLNASLKGLSKKEVDRKFDQIVEFSELGDFIDTSIRIYSAGMIARLGFSVAINMDFDILLIDEVLAVGDQAFQKKCMDRILGFKDEGKTILFVSHSMGTVQQLCDRAIWLEHGVVKGDGEAGKVIEEYIKR